MIRRYAEWRPVAVQWVPVEWWGAAAGLLTAIFSLAVLRHVSFLTYFGAGVVAYWTNRHLVERRMRGLRDDAEGGQFAAVLRLSRETAYGFDEGLVSFVDGWLVYTGRRCAFSVRREDALWLKADDKRYGFAFEGPAGKHLATLTVTEGGRFGKAYWDWSRAENVEGGPVLPPSVPNETAFVLYRSWAMLVLAVFGVVLAGLLVASEAKLGSRIISALFVAFALPATVVYARESRRALSRIADGLPYRRQRFAQFLGIRPLSQGLPSLEAKASPPKEVG